MPNRRYHIHIACTADISPSLMDSLTLFFEPKAFLTRDLLTNQTQTAAYSRRCIDSCDYVLLVATDSYGERNNTGVSQLHLSYVYAKTKNKPMTALIKTHLATEPLSRQLKDFIDLVAQHIPHCHYFDDQSNIDELLKTAYEALLAQYPGSGWVRAKDALGTALNQSVIKNYLVNENSALSQGSSYTSNLPAELADFQLLKASGRAGGETSDILWQDNKADNQPKIESTTKVDNTILPMANFESLLQSARAQVQGARAQGRAATPNLGHSSNAQLYSGADMTAVSVEDTVTLRYSAHVYEKGNLTDVNMRVPVTWLRVLQAVADIPSPFSQYSIGRSLNALVTQSAESDVKRLMPKAHAVSRCQVVTADVNIVQQTLRQAGWIEPASQSQNRREFWQLTALAKQLLLTKSDLNA